MAAAVSGCLLFAAGAALAADGPARKPRFEIFTGLATTADSAAAYTGGVWALRGGLDEPGLRLRLLGVYGEYAYDSSLPLAGGVVPVRFAGQLALGDLMLGYLWRSGDWFVKGYAGLAYAEHLITPFDPANPVTGAQWGAKGQLEIWRTLDERHWFTLDASYATAFEDYRVQARIGRRVAEWLSVGLEGGGLGNVEYHAGNGGAFLRLHLRKFEMTLAGGLTGDLFDDETRAYLTLDLRAVPSGEGWF